MKQGSNSGNTFLKGGEGGGGIPELAPGGGDLVALASLYDLLSGDGGGGRRSSYLACSFLKSLCS